MAERTAHGSVLEWSTYTPGEARVLAEEDSIRFLLPSAASASLADAQIDDYRGLERTKLLWSPPLRLSLAARFSHPAGELLGTAGFGFWNDPFTEAGAAASPNALWFFFASSPSAMELVPGIAGWGWKAADLYGHHLPAALLRIGNILLNIPGINRLLSGAAGAVIHAEECLLDAVSLTEWHDYELIWERERATWRVDGRPVLTTRHPRAAPLGFVAWMDNQYAVWRPNGDFRFGLLDISQAQWLEIKALAIQRS
jgi:hypothetical protein